MYKIYDKKNYSFIDEIFDTLEDAQDFIWLSCYMDFREHGKKVSKKNFKIVEM